MIFKIIIDTFGSIWKLKKKCNNSDNVFLRNIARVLFNAYQYENNSSISWSSKFKGEPCFPHGMKSIFISGEASVGANCVIFQQVVIGSVVLLDSDKSGAPIIGDNCYIGAGAKIIGSVTIGDNVRIGANCVVYKDVPDNSIVVSGQQRTIIKDQLLDNKFYTDKNNWKYFCDGKWIGVDKNTKSKLDSFF